MADRRLVAQSITRSGQVRQLVTLCGPFGALLFSWAITFVDDDSRLDGSPGQLRGLVFGRYSEVSEADVAEMLAVMNDIDLAVWYEVEGSPGERYLYFPRFTTHQTLREDRYGPSRLPAPPRWVPEPGHPYTKNEERRAKWQPGQPLISDLRRDKPQRDPRKTVRVPRRAIPSMNTATLWEAATTARPERATSATTERPESDQPEPPARPIGHAAGTEDASRPTSPRPTSPRLASSRHDSSHLATAEPDRLSEGTDELRSGRGHEEVRPQPANPAVLEEPLSGEARAERLGKVAGTLTGISDEHWRNVLCEVACRVPNTSIFEMSFGGTRFVEPATVVVPNEFQREWAQRYGPVVSEALGELVRFVTEGELGKTSANEGVQA